LLPNTPNAISTTMSTAATMHTTATTNRISMRRVCVRDRSCWAKKFMDWRRETGIGNRKSEQPGSATRTPLPQFRSPFPTPDVALPDSPFPIPDYRLT